MSAATAIVLFQVVAGIAIAMASLEIIVARGYLHVSAIASWDVAKLRLSVFVGRRERMWDKLFGYRSVIGLQLIRLVTAVVLVIGALTAATPALLGGLTLLLAGAQVALFIRDPNGWDGADQLLVIGLVPIGIAQLAQSETMALLALYFLTTQVVLSYLTAGLWKLASATWRRTPALTAILLTRDYGTPSLGRWLDRYPTLGRVFGWSVIMWEIGFVLALFAPPGVLIAVLAAGLAFHLSTALLMGLTSFFLAFCATYPAVYFTGGQLRSLLMGWFG
ncbi:hypothetical protein [Mycolicibacterium sp.]|uniref:hypothetical protein n=1 Tax=Mycolicibacterium sp. TaxID=2320850 RepID=UPI001A1F9958|nr:hypothetical protein [Mycolicibacterium sp.]MBJ7341726.1 hypothetical protein [Mycolicibacterium sp.]